MIKTAKMQGNMMVSARGARGVAGSRDVRGGCPGWSRRFGSSNPAGRPPSCPPGARQETAGRRGPGVHLQITTLRLRGSSAGACGGVCAESGGRGGEGRKGLCPRSEQTPRLCWGGAESEGAGGLMPATAWGWRPQGRDLLGVAEP